MSLSMFTELLPKVVITRLRYMDVSSMSVMVMLLSFAVQFGVLSKTAFFSRPIHLIFVPWHFLTFSLSQTSKKLIAILKFLHTSRWPGRPHNRISEWDLVPDYLIFNLIFHRLRASHTNDSTDVTIHVINDSDSMGMKSEANRRKRFLKSFLSIDVR